MEIDSSDHLTSSETQSIFKSCTEVDDHLGSSANYWCFELHEDDYTQVFSISLGFVLMSLGYYFLTFGAFIWASTSLKSIKCNIGNRIENDDDDDPLPIRDIVEFNWFNDGIASSHTLSTYLFMYILISFIYFTIKTFIVFIESNHYIYSMDDIFVHNDFDDFVDAKVILMIGIFLTNSTFFSCSNIFIFCFFFALRALYVRIEPDITCLSIVLLCIWGLISIIDAIFSVLICCIYYPMIVTILYFIAVGCMVLITILSLCFCLTPCVACICVQMCCDWFGFLRMYRDERDNREIQCISPFVRFLYGFTLTLLFMILVYLSQCLALVYIFGLLGGPAKSVVYLDFNSTKDRIIFWMFVATFVIGFFGLLMGLIFSCFRNSELRNQSAQMTNSIIQYHSRRIENLQEAQNYASDPFSDQRGYNLHSNNGDEH